jgi:chemotaxis protein methyltransferase CheR
MILCRNVLIYQKVESKVEIIKRISDCLMPGGYLILGAGESLLGISDAYLPMATEGIIVFQLKGTQSDSLKN